MLLLYCFKGKQQYTGFNNLCQIGNIVWIPSLGAPVFIIGISWAFFGLLMFLDNRVYQFLAYLGLLYE